MCTFSKPLFTARVPSRIRVLKKTSVRKSWKASFTFGDVYVGAILERQENINVIDPRESTS
jgi:hypothetical protein